LLSIVVGIAAALGGITAVERHDPACASCHLPPEATFVARAGTAPSDLASAHARPADADAVRCVDCHGGPGLSGRVASWRMGAGDLWHFVRGDYTVLGTTYLPAEAQRYPVADDTCRSCHVAAMADTGFENHFHTRLSDPERPAELSCVGCHLAHKSEDPGTAGSLTPAMAAQCEACHLVLGGPVGLVDATPVP
jgi:hypothetical protein